MSERSYHSLVAYVTIAILAVLSGADGFVAIATYGKAKQAWLEKFLDLPHGIPSQNEITAVPKRAEVTQPQGGGGNSRCDGDSAGDC